MDKKKQFIKVLSQSSFTHPRFNVESLEFKIKFADINDEKQDENTSNNTAREKIKVKKTNSATEDENNDDIEVENASSNDENEIINLEEKQKESFANDNIDEENKDPTTTSSNDENKIESDDEEKEKENTYGEYGEVINDYNAGFEELLSMLENDYKVLPHEQIGLKISIPSIEHTKTAGLSFRPMSSLSAKIIIDLLASVMQSNSNFTNKDIIEVTTTIVRIPSGGGKKTVSRIRPKRLSDDEILKFKNKSLILTYSKYNDNKCLPRALVLAKALADGDNKAIKCMKKKNSTLLAAQVSQLIKKCNIIIGDNGCTITDLYKFSKILSDYQITVYDDKDDFKSIIFKSK